MAEPRARPVLFSGAMVRAILDGRKTVTRRVVKPQPAPNAPHDGGTTWVYRAKEGRHVPCGTVGHLTVAEKMGLLCPYGVPGDRLWVRETWRTVRSLDNLSPRGMAKACIEAGYSYPWAPISYEADGRLVNFDRREDLGKTRVSIHMPRWASRLTLEVTGVRVERLQDISEADAQAEGVERSAAPFTHGWRNYEPEPQFESVSYHPSARESFASLWRSINGPGSWDANPWVWVVGFRRVEAPHG